MRQYHHLENLRKNIYHLEEATHWLQRSYSQCTQIGLKDQYTIEELDLFEALTSRFARVSDMVLHKIFRSIDAVELESGGTLIDVVNRVHKRNLIHSVDELREIKDLQNELAHEYIQSLLVNLFKDCLRFTPKLFQIVDNINNYCRLYTLGNSGEK